MHKNGTRHRSHSDYDLNSDFLKIRDAIYETTQDMKGKTGELLSQSLDGIKDKSHEIQDNIASYTGEKPFTTIAVAFAGGFILGLLMKRKRS